MGRYLDIARRVLDDPDLGVNDSSTEPGIERTGSGEGSCATNTKTTNSTKSRRADTAVLSTKSTKSAEDGPDSGQEGPTDQEEVKGAGRPFGTTRSRCYSEWSPSEWGAHYEEKRLVLRTGGLTRHEAEARARRQVKALLIEHTDWPSSGSALGSQIRRAHHGACFVCGSSRFWESRSGTTLCASCHPPVRDQAVARWIERDIPPGILKTSYSCPVANDAVAKVNAVRDQALALRWTEDGLYRNHGDFPFPCGPGYGLVCFLGPNRCIGNVRTDAIEIVSRAGDGQMHILQLPNPDVRNARSKNGNHER